MKLTVLVKSCGPDEPGFWGRCVEVPGANGQGETEDACVEDTIAAAQLLLETVREEARNSGALVREIELAEA